MRGGSGRVSIDKVERRKKREETKWPKSISNVPTAGRI